MKVYSFLIALVITILAVSCRPPNNLPMPQQGKVIIGDCVWGVWRPAIVEIDSVVPVNIEYFIVPPAPQDTLWDTIYSAGDTVWTDRFGGQVDRIFITQTPDSLGLPDSLQCTWHGLRMRFSQWRYEFQWDDQPGMPGRISGKFCIINRNHQQPVKCDQRISYIKEGSGLDPDTMRWERKFGTDSSSFILLRHPQDQ